MPHVGVLSRDGVLAIGTSGTGAPGGITEGHS